MKETAPNLTYRHDIQGLRGAAVLAITLFHISWRWLPGGFIGVDVFFVISGFLIFRIIQTEIETNQFSLQRFYTNRVKRLFPALFVACAICSVFVLLYALPSETVTFAESLIATLTYLSNVYFYFETNYFFTGPGASPLLHTWSLSVEEQYYIIFPLLLIWLNKQFKARLFSIAVISLVLLTCFSFIVSEISSTLAFYSLPTRAFQFIAGALVALALNKYVISRTIATPLFCLSILGLATSAIMLNGYQYSTFTSAGIAAGLASTLLLSGEQAHRYAKLILENPVFLYLGKISYSMYLWHWPIIIIYTTAFNPTPDLLQKLLLLFASILAGHISWQYVEQPCRYPNNRRSSKLTLITTASCTIALTTIGTIYLVKDGFPDRYTSEQLHIDSFVGYINPKQRNGTCFLSSTSSNQEQFDPNICITINNNTKNYLLLGDSHAAHLYSAIKSQLPDSSVSQITASGCRPLVPTIGADTCVDLINTALNVTIKEYNFDGIIISGLWGKDDYQRILATVNYLSDFTDKVVIIGPIITYRQPLPKLILRSSNKADPEAWIAKSSFYLARQKLDQQFSAAIQNTDAIYVSLIDEMCSHSTCKTIALDGSPMQFDTGHLTHGGAVDIVNSLISQKIL